MPPHRFLTSSVFPKSTLQVHFTFHNGKNKMGEALFELEQILRSKYQITREEENILSICKGKAVREFTVSACVASVLAWTALRKFGYGYRINLSGGAAVLSGMWRFNNSLDSCVDNILAMEGSRMQNELANVLLTKHQHDSRIMNRIRKHFYPERVYDDSTTDQPVLRWRFRNYFSDGAHRRSEENDANFESEELPEPAQFTGTVKASLEMGLDPLESIFGYSKAPEEIHCEDASTDVAKKRSYRSQRRSQRRHRARHRSDAVQTM